MKKGGLDFQDKGFFDLDFPTDKLTAHNYTFYYDVLLAPYINQRYIKILELGVKKGGSLKMWRELFDESANIYGIDIEQGAPMFEKDAHIKILVLDTKEWTTLRKAFIGIIFAENVFSILKL